MANREAKVKVGKLGDFSQRRKRCTGDHTDTLAEVEVETFGEEQAQEEDEA